MDLVLRVADEYVLDTVWAKLVPVSAFAASVNRTILDASNSFLNASAPPILLPDSPVSTWSHIVSYLPHPPLASDVLSPAVEAIPILSAWPRDYMPRQIISPTILTLIGSHFLYFAFSYLSYAFIFNHDMMKHPKFLKNQVKLEIQTSLAAFPVMTALTVPFFVAEVRGYSKLYTDVSERGWGYLAFSAFL